MVGILGGYGDIGRNVTAFLEKYSDEKIRIGSRHPERKLSGEHSDRISYEYVDITDIESVKRFINGCNAVVNCTGCNDDNVVAAADAVSAAGCGYIDLCMNEKLKAGGKGKVVYGCGSIPGLAELMMLYLGREFEKPEDMNFIYGALGNFSLTAAQDYLEGVLKSSGRSMVCLKNGKVTECESLTELEQRFPFTEEKCMMFPYIDEGALYAASELGLSSGSWYMAFAGNRTLAQMGTTAHEIREILDHKEIERNGSDNNEGDLELKVDNITFRYSDTSENVLSGISFSVPKGSMLALVGPSGGGKSTIAKLLAGYWEPASGVISIGGNSINNFSQEKFNRLVSGVDQDTFLFDMSIMENIRIGKKDATDEEVIAAAKRAGCDEFIRSLPDGYNTSVGEAGGKLSGGERQRIAIARAIMKDSPIMIFDEATASADPENEALIQKALSEAGRDKTLVVVAHKLSTITSAEQIAYIEKGTVKCIGTHEEMLRKCPEYQNLWNITSSNGGEA